MKISDLIAMCLRNLLRRKFRTTLTIIGVVIGTCAIVVTISLGIGINESQKVFLESFGDLSVIEVYTRGGDDVLLNDEMVATFQNMPEVKAVTPFARYYPSGGGMSLYQGKKERFTYWYNPVGLYPDAMEALGYDVAEGKMFTPGAKKIQVVFGSRAAYEFYNTKNGNWVDYYGMPEDEMPDPFFDPMESDFHFTLTYSDGGTEKVYKYDVEVVGILSTDISDYESTYMIYMHIDDLKRIQTEYEKANGIKRTREEKEKQQYDSVKVKVADLKKVGEVQKTIEGMGLYAWSMDSWRQSMQEQTGQIQMILGLLGGVSLFVAAISITNTMIMSVYERTREIGVMKVLGCLLKDIRSVFLIEAGLIGFIGGIAGIGLSLFLSYLLNTFGGSISSALGGIAMEGSKVSIIPSWLMLLGLVFATLIGIVSGFTPANRAVRISALEAIKTE